MVVGNKLEIWAVGEIGITLDLQSGIRGSTPLRST